MAQPPIVVQVQGVGKSYRLGVINRQQLTDDLKAWTARLLGKPDPTVPIGQEVDSQRIGETFWALRDINFEVRQGEVLGIIGHNGAGKSTMLKLLSRITLPTEGTIRMKGRVSALLEVGTGFHPELTGRENVYLNAAILGMRKHEINAKMDEIIAFSGIKHHIDTPVKRYSSGMRVRLGFAVAAFLEPEILIIDEVLSVGDAEFRRKSMGKMRDTALSGRTVLFVSHSMTAVRSLCSRVIWLDKGRVRMQGPTEDVVAAYLGHYTQDMPEVYWSEDNAPGNEVARLSHVKATPASGGDRFKWEDAIDVEIGVVNHSTQPIHVNIQVVNADDLVIFTTNSREGGIHGIETGMHIVNCRFPAHLFNSGDLRLNVGIVQNAKMVFKTENAIAFTVVEPARESNTWQGRRNGMFKLIIPWNSGSKSHLRSEPNRAASPQN